MLHMGCAQQSACSAARHCENTTHHRPSWVSPHQVLRLPSPLSARPPAEAADRALRAKVSSLLSSLAANDAFCGLLAAELKKSGIV